MRAACRDHTRPGVVWSKSFADDMAQEPEGTEYRWPASVLQAMKVCATCPVRTECITDAYLGDRLVGPLVGDDPPPTGKPRRYGVYGGIPGRMRERFAQSPNRIALGEAWLLDVADKEHWPMNQEREVRSA